MSNNNIEKAESWRRNDAGTTGKRRFSRAGIEAIVKGLIEGERVIDVAQRYGVTASVITQIKNGESYRDIVTGEAVKRMNGGKTPSTKKRLSESDREKIREMVANEVNRDKIASIYNINKSTVWRISNKK